MSRYLVCQKIWTVADLEAQTVVEGFLMDPFGPEKGLLGDAWAASQEVEAASGTQAFFQSRQSLLRVIDAISLVTQCVFSVIAASFYVYRLTDNPDGLLYLRHLRHRKTVGITLWKEEQLDDIAKLLTLEGPTLHYLRESSNASTAKTRLAMLVIATEALAGQTTVTGNCQNCGCEYRYGGTDKDRLKRILGEDAYSRLYVKDDGALRHRLFHGSTVDDGVVSGIAGVVYDRLLEHLQKQLGLGSIEKIVAAPRTFQSVEWAGIFLRWSEAMPPHLQDLERRWHALGEPAEAPGNY